MKKYCLLSGLSLVTWTACFHTIEPAQAGTDCGVATYYDIANKTASGEFFDAGALTAAHPSLPLGTWITVEDLDTGLTVDVRVNDRGPWVGENYILDLTPTAMNAIDPHRTSDVRSVCIHW